MTQQVCKSCLGKKQESVFKGPSIASADFPGDKSYVVDKGGIKMVDCSRCKGTGLEPVFEKETKYAIKCSTDEQESECKCKGGRHCEFCRKADSGGAGIEKLKYVLDGKRPLNTPLTDANMSRIESKINEIIDRINKQ